jgi:hypothetical protein
MVDDGRGLPFGRLVVFEPHAPRRRLAVEVHGGGRTVGGRVHSVVHNVQEFVVGSKNFYALIVLVVLILVPGKTVCIPAAERRYIYKFDWGAARVRAVVVCRLPPPSRRAALALTIRPVVP